MTFEQMKNKVEKASSDLIKAQAARDEAIKSFLREIDNIEEISPELGEYARTNFRGEGDVTLEAIVDFMTFIGEHVDKMKTVTDEMMASLEETVKKWEELTE